MKNMAGLEAAYLSLNQTTIVENAIKEALAKAGQPTASAEKPGPGGGKTPAETEIKPGDSKGRIMRAIQRNVPAS